MKNSLKTEIKFILLAFCTFKRPNMLEKCLKSISELNLPENIRTEILIIDNDESASAKDVVEKNRNDLQITVNYFIEEKRGLSNARNKLISEAINLGASHIAMFDDDIILPENWLINYVNYYNNNENAVIITAPSYSKFTKEPPEYISKNDLFKCHTTKKTGSVRQDAASGNVFFPTTLITELKLNFNSEYVFMGGEDGRFFGEASTKGAEIVWCNDCFNWELNGTDKINIKWIIRRSYYNGYSAAQRKMKNKNKFSKLLYGFKQLICLFFNLIGVPLSLLTGMVNFVNMLGFSAKSYGRLTGALKNSSLNYYQNVYGN